MVVQRKYYNNKKGIREDKACVCERDSKSVVCKEPFSGIVDKSFETVD